MPKLKTHSGTKDRVKLTKNGGAATAHHRCPGLIRRLSASSGAPPGLRDRRMPARLLIGSRAIALSGGPACRRLLIDDLGLRVLPMSLGARRARLVHRLPGKPLIRGLGDRGGSARSGGPCSTRT